MTADLELMARNRRLLAERTGWPPNALAKCERLDRLFPGWSVMWRGECTAAGLEHPAGFVADRLTGDVVVCAETVSGLIAAMVTAPTWMDEWWKRDKCCARRWSSAR